MPRRAAISIIVLVCIILSACTSAPVTTIVPGMAQTLAVRTMVALKGPAIFATPTPIPSMTPMPQTLTGVSSSNQYQLLIPPTILPVPSLTPFKALASWLQNDKKCADIGEFIRDVTIEDYSQFKPNELFTKIWQVKNVGTCTWTTSYALVFTFGDRMSGISPKYLIKPVQPGDIVDLSIDLVAPKEGDIYQGNWMLQDENERQFGTGVAAKDFFWVSIMVGSSGMSDLFGGIGGCLKGG